jgi:FMN phosphatase YigB (HAD superfamily)
VTEIEAVVLDFHDTIAALEPSFSEILAAEADVSPRVAHAVVTTLEPRVDEHRRSGRWLADRGGIGWDWWYSEFCALSGSGVAPQIVGGNVAERLADPVSYVRLPNVDRDLTTLQGMGLTLGCASNTVFDLDLAIRHLELDGYFDYTATARDLGASKPSRVFFQRVAMHLGLRMSGVLFVGDKAEEDAAAAVRSGMTGVWLAPGVTCARLVEAGYFVVPDLSSIAAVIAEVAANPVAPTA